MKPLPLTLLSFLSLSASVLAQQVGMPPQPGAMPPAPAAADPGSGTTTSVTGGTITSGSLAAVSTADESQAPSEAPVDPEASTDAATASSSTPPGLPEAGAADPAKKVDFLQRSNLVLAKLLESERAVDPFGLTMDPANAKEAPLLADQYEETEETTVVNNSMLKNALLTLPITGVYPQREQIVIGARSFKIGDQFGMKLQDLTIRLRFEGIRNGEVFFKDMETREVTSLPFNTRPAEFEPMVKGSKRAPGSGIVPMNDLYIAN